jgi:hypothetical protein
MSLIETLSTNLYQEIPIKVSVYTAENKAQWDKFVTQSKNGTFLFYRDYMEYHSNRFFDHSLLFWQNEALVGLMPANLESHVLNSHGGLTFGGVIAGFEMTQSLMLQIFQSLLEHCRSQGIKQVIYKPIPYIYHLVPSDEDLYALHINNAHLIGRSISSTIYLPEKQPLDSRRKESLRKARKHCLTVKRSYDLATFMSLAEFVLVQKHGVHPVHTLEELATLMVSFPDNIKLFGAYRGDEMVAGIIIYETQNVAHGQYAANSNVGRTMGAQDIIEDYLISTYYKDKKYYDFGVSTLKLGRELNDGLLIRKEGFGASAVNYDFFEIVLL